MTAENTLVLVDGSSYLYRAYHAMPDLRADPGNPASPATGALRGMINMLQALRKEAPARYAACVFDTSGATFRDALYPDYKANRAPMPEDLRAQIAPIHEAVQALGWPLLAIDGVEADDVIATLATQAAAQGLQVLISSGDKDLAQLVDERITIYDTMSGKRRDAAGVLAEFGVPPERMIDFQTLVGDAVDNVPGVAKVGPKTAAKWLSEYGSLEQLLAQAGQIKGVAGQNLRAALDWLPTARQLVTMKRDVAGLPAPQALEMRAPDQTALAALYQQYGFKSLLRGLQTQAGEGSGAGSGADAGAARPGAAQAQAAAPAPAGYDGPLRYQIIQDWASFDAALTRWQAAELVAIDTETTSL
ncbi:MAG: 5'-3' exonuclease H3TH domain-containing protein, partial [Comamonadaceae bacterium]|nr:5'-3' exonuclease H3TH domain-containing protein [Comamonadaceae bacterium]